MTCRGMVGLVVAGDDFWPAAAKVLAALLDKLHPVSAGGRRGRLVPSQVHDDESTFGLGDVT